MNITLVQSSPVPLYHQIVEAIRYRIATGALPAGARLPSLREASERWGVNLHTVRHAYAALAEQGLVVTEGPAGTRVLGIRPGSGVGERTPEARRGFVERVAREAWTEFGMSVGALRDALAAIDPPGHTDRPSVWVTECTDIQSAALAQQLGAVWDVDARPWCFTEVSDAPAGVILGTYFHYNELRSRWPDRRSDLRFVVIAPDTSVAKRIRAERGAGVPTRFYLCELDDEMAHNIAADLTVELPRDDYEVVPFVVRDAREAFAATPDDGPILFTPRTWGALSPGERTHPRAYELTYVIDRADAERVARELNWRIR